MSKDQPRADELWGGTVIDPFGHKWSLGTHVEDVAPDEMARRMQAWSGTNSG